MRIEVAIQLHRATMNEAKQRLALAIEREHAERLAYHQAEEAIFQEAEAVSNLAESDMAVEAFGKWLSRARAAAEAAQRRYDYARSEVSKARAEIILARIAARGLEQLRDSRKERIKVAESIRVQNELNDAFSRPSTRDDVS